MDTSKNYILQPFREIQQNVSVPTTETLLNCVTNGFRQLTVNDKSHIIKTKVRRKPRQKRKNVVTTVANMISDNNLPGSSKIDLIDNSNFKITAVCNQNSGKVFRIKKLGCRHIHKSFYSNCDDDIAGGHQSNVKTQNEFSDKIHNTTPVANRNGTISYNTVSPLDSSNLQSKTNASNASIRNSAKKKKSAKKLKQYPPYWKDEEVHRGLSNGLLIKGVLRINQKNRHEAYVTDPDQSLQDYFLPTMVDRNRALEGDFVAIKVNSRTEWTEKHKTAHVVYITEKVHPRVAVGYLLPMTGKKKMFATFIPRDKRVPRVKIPLSSCPDAFHKQKNSLDILYKVRITSWLDLDFAQGVITDLLGMSGNLDSELIAILAEHNISTNQFPPNLSEQTDTIPTHEYANRLDLRKECIFTIDPLTARDLDDAVSCKELPNGNLQVGVHISDVTFYVIEGTPLDLAVRKKATSVYLVNNVYHMLPEELCKKCSLLPGVDKRAFSVIWEMRPNGEIVNQTFARSVVNSCSQLSYEHAQMMIEDPNRHFEQDELPEIHGGFTYNDLNRIVNTLNPIAVQMRQQRFDNGALRIDQTKLLFRLNQNTSEPEELFTYENKDAHRLIEEFMLLANISVATKIAKDFPKLAFLRCHDPPKESMLVEMKKNLNAFGLDLDISSSKALQNSILALHDKLGVPQLAAVNHLLAKPMNRARYFCAATQNSTADFSHYALHVPLYTHFTSPIRRYADVMVHRLLASSLGYTVKPKWSVDMVSSIAVNCNRQKYSAKQAGDASSDLFLAHYVEKYQPFIKTAVVFQVRSHSFDVLVNATGSIIRIHEKGFDKGLWQFQENENYNTINLVFPETSEYCEEIIRIKMFETVTVNLTRKANTNALEAQLLRPVSSTLIVNTGALNS
ncbi:hypothetical protein RN001_013856 [Aquatica leii]|uniref:RNB domain-containing protein n=1 Tax=Aquatica leii TaxID=1421715 RepID=A0AAN7P364_9COLE|nr:hypothetical protein RN001_013856 [Aquatica leii]